MNKSILIFTSIFASFFSHAYEKEALAELQSNDQQNVVIDVISYDKNNPNRHLNFAKIISELYPKRNFSFMFHGSATFNAIKTHLVSDKSLNLELQDLSIVKDLDNIELFVCKVGVLKKGFNLDDVNEDIFDSSHTSSRFIKDKKKEGFLIIIEEEL